MAKRWKKEEITYLKRYAKQRTLEELAARFQVAAGAVDEKLSELGLKTSDGMGKVDLSDDPVVKIYEKGLQAVHTGKWSEAKRLFAKVMAKSDLAEVVERAEQYQALCERRIESEAKAGDPYLEAVLLHNEGDLDAAEALCEKGGRLESDERFAYLAAAIAARREDYEQAASRLEKAIELNPRNRIQVVHDLDFEPMREAEEFAELVS